MELLTKINAWVWGVPTMALLVGTGVWLTLVLKGLQFRLLPHAFYLAFIKRSEPGADGDISHFQALMTALSATVGVGNIAGVATAIAAGGPGAMFWMWCTGLVGMATKYAEALLAVKYRVIAPDGSMSGGPMYYMARGLGQRWLAVLFASFAVLASFGIGNMTQANTVADALTSLGVAPVVTGGVLCVLTGLVVVGGIRSIGRVTSVLVPVMIGVYGIASLLVLVLRAEAIPEALRLIFSQAFTPTAAVGGFAGAVVRKTVQMGIARGLFSNESGLGSSPIAAAAAKSNHPASQALVSMTQTFIDTLVVCSMTGLAIVVTGVWKSGMTGAALTLDAYGSVLGGGGRLAVQVSLVLFAYSTIIGWVYYGEQALAYLAGHRMIPVYRCAFVLCVWLGAVLKLETVWLLADTFNGLMALPNLVALIGLTPVIINETRHYLTCIRLAPAEI